MIRGPRNRRVTAVLVNEDRMKRRVPGCIISDELPACYVALNAGKAGGRKGQESMQAGSMGRPEGTSGCLGLKNDVGPPALLGQRAC